MQVTSSDACGSSTATTNIPAAGSCNLSYTTSPTQVGPNTQYFRVTTDASLDFDTFTENVVSAVAVPTLTPTSSDFGSIAAGSTSAAHTFTLTNAGNAVLPITSTAFAGSNAGSFRIADSNCGTSLAGGSSCKVLVTFSPAAAGSDSATLNIVDSIGTQTAALTGTSFAGTPQAAVTPASVDFGTLTLGIAGNPRTITLTNAGNTALPFASFAITGPNASSFEVRNGGCPKSIPARANCPIDVIFIPTTAGTDNASLSFTDSLGTQSATLTGKAVYASATLVPAPGSSTNFGNVTVGAQAGAAVRLNNTSQAPITVTGVLTTGTGFTVDAAGSCSAPVPSGSLCEVEVLFNPTAVGPASGILSVTTDIAGVLTLAVSGSGILPTATLTPATYGFGSVPVGTSSGPVRFTFTNTSPVP